MQRVGFMLKVKASMIDEYKRRHLEVWPEMKDALRSAGWHNYSLFMAADGLLFGYFETPVSLDAANAAMAATTVNERWQRDMAPFFELPPGAAPDTSMLELEPVFHLA